MKKTVLITNDDGIFSPALEILRKRLNKNYNTIVVVPDGERSAVSMAITLNQPLRLTEIEPDVYTTDGYPSDCVNIAVKRVCKTPPDLIISGMNKGENLGVDIFYSGTVGGAFAGHLLDIPSLSVSLLSGSKDRGFDYEKGAEITEKIVDSIIDEPFRKCVYNVNIPYDCNGEVLHTKPGGKLYFTDMLEEKDPRGKKIFWTGGGSPYYSEDKSSDTWAVKNGYVSFSVLKYDISTDILGDFGKKLFS